MADTRISSLTAGSALAATDVIPAVETAGTGPVTKTAQQLATGLLGSTTFNGATVTTSLPVANFTQTWNAGGVVFTGLKFNATNTASAAGSLLLDLQLGGTSLFKVDKSTGFSLTSNGNGSQIQSTSTSVSITTSAGTNGFGVIGNGIPTVSLGLAINGTNLNSTGDVILTRAAAATLQLGAADVSSGAVAQTLTVQNNTGAATTGPDFKIIGSGGLTVGGNILLQTKATTTAATALQLTALGGVLAVNATGGLGYGTGAGGTVTQATSRTTGVTLNKVCGAITLVSAAGSASYQSFTVTNSVVAATDTIHISQQSGTDKNILLVTNVASGSFQITFATTGGTTTETPVINFSVIKSVTA